MVQFKAKRKDLPMLPNASAISKISGGIGKNIDSIKASIKRAIGPKRCICPLQTPGI
jgi:hypothetical protein